MVRWEERIQKYKENTMKATMIKLAALILGGIAMARAEGTVLKILADKPTDLYGGQASSVEGDIKKQGGDNFRWRGSGHLTWEVRVDQPGEYQVNLCHAAEPAAIGQQLQISSGQSQLSYKLAMTQEVFGKKSYALTPIQGSLHLAAGTNTISLGIEGAPATMAVLAFRSLELTPVAAKARIEAERQEALRARASTEWLAKAGYGLMFHWTSQSIGKDGTHKPYAQAVDEFDLNRFADMVEATGAGYVILTIGHAQTYCPAPLASWEKYHPGMTTRRDLIAGMADALQTKGIKLICYLNVAGLGQYRNNSREEFSRLMTEVLTEFGEHYQEKVAGYWFDCFYQAREKYPDFSFRDFFKACKAGNPNRIIALNSWIYPNVSEWQEYWAGETSDPVGLPVNGTNPSGPGQGLRYQSLIIMEPYWVQQRVEMPGQPPGSGSSVCLDLAHPVHHGQDRLPVLAELCLLPGSGLATHHRLSHDQRDRGALPEFPQPLQNAGRQISHPLREQYGERLGRLRCAGRIIGHV
jgi:hypothetical protein